MMGTGASNVCRVYKTNGHLFNKYGVECDADYDTQHDVVRSVKYKDKVYVILFHSSNNLKY